ncbi:hypothetical protein E7T09_16240 [Deinococcus sp. KSM4-11]|nr:hypothetical protein E7T09_16240 [Deinococcus sp. KSM4-11]
MSRAADLPGTADLRLTVTFRCPQVAVDLAAEFTDDIKAAPGARHGEVVPGSEDERLTWLRPGDLVMARRNAPVVSLALKLASLGVPVEVLGHDLTKLLEGHVGRALAYPFALSEIEGRLSEYGMARLQEHYESGVRGKALRRQLREDADLLACIATVAGEVAWHAEQEGARGTAAGVMAVLGSLLGAKGRAVRLCTIHKAKGLEAERVAVLEAEEVMEAGRQDAQRGDRALAFVALTRTKDVLFLASAETSTPHPEGEGNHETD